MRTKAFLWTLLGCLVAPPIATAQTVYFSMGNEIQKLALNNGGPTLVHTSNRPVRDLALCAGDPDTSPLGPDRQYLYFVERGSEGYGDRISRLDVNTPLGEEENQNASAQVVFDYGETDTDIGELRLTIDCDVLFATPAGVFQASGTPPATATALLDATTTNGSGLAIAFDGSLRFSDGADIESRPAGFAATAGGTIIGLGIANGGAGSAMPFFSDADDGLGIGSVCASTANMLKCAPRTGGSLSPFATFQVPYTDAVSLAQFFEFLTNDVAIVATSVDPNNSIPSGTPEEDNDFNGILWMVTESEGEVQVTELFRALEEEYAFAPIVGVAVGPSESAWASTSNTTEHVVKFGPVAIDVVTTQACSLNFQLKQNSWEDAQQKLDNVTGNPNTYLLDPGFGGESWIDVVAVYENVNDCGPFTLALSQFNDALANKALLHCESGPVCNAITLSNYPFTSPTDPRDSGREDDFSDFLTAKTQLAAGGDNQILFMNPLDNRAAVKDGTIDSEIPFATTHHGGLSVRFQICTGTDCKKFLPGEAPIGSISGATLSITALDVISGAGIGVADCEIDDNGDSAPDIPVFRVGGKVHNFNLRTPLLGPPACELTDLAKGESRLFVATISSLSGRFNKTSILFRLRK